MFKVKQHVKRDVEVGQRTKKLQIIIDNRHHPGQRGIFPRFVRLGGM